MLKYNLHLKLAVGAKAGNVQIRIHYFNVRIGGYVACLHLALSMSADRDLLGAFAVQLNAQLFYIEHYLGNVLANAFDGSELMQHAVYPYGRGGHAGQGGKQHPAQ